MPCAGLHLLEGNIMASNEELYYNAQTEYVEAENIIETGLDPNFILEFDKLDLRYIFNLLLKSGTRDN